MLLFAGVDAASVEVHLRLLGEAIVRLRPPGSKSRGAAVKVDRPAAFLTDDHRVHNGNWIEADVRRKRCSTLINCRDLCTQPRRISSSLQWVFKRSSFRLICISLSAFRHILPCELLLFS